jgi:hypothetical protein
MVRLRAALWKVLVNVAAVVLIVAGMILGPLPVLPGTPLVSAGILLLDFKGKKELLLKVGQTRVMQWVMERSPQLAAFWQKMGLRP